MKYFFLVLSSLLPLGGFTQGSLSVDKTRIMIGDQIHATIRIDLNNGAEWKNAETVWPDTMKGMEIVSGPVWSKDNPSATLATWVVTFFDTGIVRIPRLPLIIERQGQLDTSFTLDIPIIVNAVEPDSSGLKEIKDIYVQPFNPGYYKRYIPHAIVFLLILAGLIFWLRRRQRKQVIAAPAPIPLLPHEWAYDALNTLAEQKLWQHGEVKEHYTYLTAILREYLERRYGIRAMEQTSDQIIDQLRFRLMNEALLQDTEELLSVADLIKFAKADPGMDIHAATIERVRSFVKLTTISHDQSPAADSLNTSGDEIVA